MPRKLLVWGLLFGALCLLTGLTGCRQSDASRAEDTARAFMSGGRDASFALLTKMAQEKMSVNFSKDTVKSMPDAKFGPTTIANDTAEVGLSATENGADKRGKVLLRRENGDWRVYGIRAEMAPGTEITFDFEHPESMMGEMMKAMSQGMADGMKAMGKGLGEGMRGFAQGVSGAPDKK